MNKKSKPNRPANFTLDDFSVACDFVKDSIDVEEEEKNLKIPGKICYLKYFKKEVVEHIAKNLPHFVTFDEIFRTNHYTFTLNCIDILFDFLRLKKSKYRIKISQNSRKIKNIFKRY